MPKNNVADPITDQEIAFARLVLSGTMTDRRAAEAVGLNPDTAAYTKAKPRVRAYMLEHRAAVQQKLVEQETEQVRRVQLGRDQILGRLWEIANLSPEMTRGSITGQVKALSMIMAIEGLVPDVPSARRLRAEQTRPSACPLRKYTPALGVASSRQNLGPRAAHPRSLSSRKLAPSPNPLPVGMRRRHTSRLQLLSLTPHLIPATRPLPTAFTLRKRCSLLPRTPESPSRYQKTSLPGADDLSTQNIQNNQILSNFTKPDLPFWGPGDEPEALAPAGTPVRPNLVPKGRPESSPGRQSWERFEKTNQSRRDG